VPVPQRSPGRRMRARTWLARRRKSAPLQRAPPRTTRRRARRARRTCGSPRLAIASLRHKDRRCDPACVRPGDACRGCRARRDDPAARSASVSVATLLSAPRSLNEPVRWRFSAFRSTSRPAIARTSPSEPGLAGDTPIRARAARRQRPSARPCPSIRNTRSALWTALADRGAPPHRREPASSASPATACSRWSSRAEARANTSAARRSRRRCSSAPLARGARDGAPRRPRALRPLASSASVRTIGIVQPRAPAPASSAALHERLRSRMVAPVDCDHVRDLHHASLQRLDRIARARHRTSTRCPRCRARRLALPMPTVSTRITPFRLRPEEHGLEVASESRRGGRAFPSTDEDLGVEEVSVRRSGRRAAPRA